MEISLNYVTNDYIASTYNKKKGVGSKIKRIIIALLIIIIPFIVVNFKTTKLQGDVNNDRKLTMSDLIIVRDVLIGNTILANPSVADMNHDGVITISDLIKIRNMLDE